MKAILRIAFIVLTAAAPLFAASQEDLKIEGIVYDGENGENSYAVVDGNFLKKGDSYQGYKITSVSSTSIQAVDEKSGKERQFHITGGEPSPYLPPIPNAPGSQKPSGSGPGGVDTAGQPQQGTNPLAQMLEQLRSMLGVKEDGTFQFPGGGSDAKKGSSANPFAKFINIAWEVKAITELKNIYQMAAAYYMQRNEPIKGIEELVQGKMISKEFADGESGPYRFYLKSSAQELEVHADPVDKSSGLRYFMISEETGSVRMEQGKPATAESPAISPSNMMPWMNSK